ncbi:hypothetical protein [Streptomyces olivochromogenes]|uniref:hypothetical protein n=1 Tax=Streptomyces olivochromogenes TaxID=1963 RepID=UPI001F254EE2|nr:hypothetical protein [Streptomyces olivochromogenes]MCF3130729.1 hypothetical protein [Streptomyces olivochromogenes]
MTNGIAPAPERPPGAKLTIRVYTVTREGVVSAPRASVSVPHDYVPHREGIGTHLPPCACPQHREVGARR